MTITPKNRFSLVWDQVDGGVKYIAYDALLKTFISNIQLCNYGEWYLLAVLDPEINRYPYGSNFVSRVLKTNKAGKEILELYK
jgi:hypothetical protein